MILSAVIFDLDGTVLCDEDEYKKAFAKVLKDLGAKIPKDFSYTKGVGVKENWPILLAKYKIRTESDLDTLTSRTQEEYLKLLDGVTIRPGFERFVEDLKQSEIEVALATSNEWWIVDEIFKKTGLGEYFDNVTTAEEVIFEKPNPDLFLVVAEKLNVLPKECLVFEDSEAGVLAVRDAGMRVVGIADTKEAEEILRNKSDLVIRDFTEVTPEKLLLL